MKDKIKGFVAGATVMGMLIGSAAYAAGGGSQIEVFFKDLKYMFDGIQKTPSEGTGFIYNGTTYVPLRFVSEALDKKVEWDGENETIWVGQKLASFSYLTKVEYARADGRASNDAFYVDKIKSNSYTNYKDESIKIAGTKFENSMSVYLSPYASEKTGTLTYNLNGNYSQLTGKIGIDDAYKNSKASGKIRIIADGKEVVTVK